MRLPAPCSCGHVGASPGSSPHPVTPILSPKPPHATPCRSEGFVFKVNLREVFKKSSSSKSLPEIFFKMSSRSRLQEVFFQKPSRSLLPEVFFQKSSRSLPEVFKKSSSRSLLPEASSPPRVEQSQRGPRRCWSDGWDEMLANGHGSMEEDVPQNLLLRAKWIGRGGADGSSTLLEGWGETSANSCGSPAGFEGDEADGCETPGGRWE